MVSNKLPLLNRILNILLDMKIIRKLYIDAYFFPEMIIYKRYFDKIKCIYFDIKDDFFDDEIFF